MLMLRGIIVVICGLTLFLVNAQDYEVPEATVEVFKPKGLRVSIPGMIKMFLYDKN